MNSKMTMMSVTTFLMPTTKTTKIVLGIDPGYAITGYGVLRYEKSICATLTYGVITTAPQELFSKRLERIHTELQKIILRYKPDIIAIEKLFFAKNAKTALKVGEARGVAILTAAQSKKTIREFTPLQIKQAITGYGFASKSQIQKMVQQILKLKSLPKPDDAADALAVALCCGQTKDFS